MEGYSGRSKFDPGVWHISNSILVQNLQMSNCRQQLQMSRRRGQNPIDHCRRFPYQALSRNPHTCITNPGSLHIANRGYPRISGAIENCGVLNILQVGLIFCRICEFLEDAESSSCLCRLPFILLSVRAIVSKKIHRADRCLANRFI
jgi:hypothetical protein